MLAFAKQDCIPVGCVPPARWPYLPACSVAGGSAPGGEVGGWGVCSWGCVCLFQGGVWSGGVSAPRGVSDPGGVSVPGGCLLLGWMSAPGGCVCSWGVSAPGGSLLWGGVCSGGCVSQHALRQTPPPVNRMTDACKNFNTTLPQLRCCLAVKIVHILI